MSIISATKAALRKTRSSLRRFARCSPGVDEADKLGREAAGVVVDETRGGTLHHLGELVEDAVPLGVGEAAGRHLHLRSSNQFSLH